MSAPVTIGTGKRPDASWSLEPARLAMHWHPEGDRVMCTLCPHLCKVSDGKGGICGVRRNVGGKLYTWNYERPSSIAVDPVEKKGLSHFYPGTQSLSFGSAGCNMGCMFCQNSSISQVKPEDIPLASVKAAEIPGMVRSQGASSCTWTYNEPTIWHEWTMECAPLLREAGIQTIYKTNGFICKEPFDEIVPHIDAWSVDTKAFTKDFYRRITKSRMEPVHSTCLWLKEKKKHLEFTYLMITDHNDDPGEIAAYVTWVLENFGDHQPVHFTRYHPDFRMMHVPQTPMDRMVRAWGIARRMGLKFCYLGNVPHGEWENTYCPTGDCHALLVERQWFKTTIANLKGDRCARCGTRIPLTGLAEQKQSSWIPRSVF